ncbi:uncharacterized protein ARB_07109 [Trichophyton benhamiae CBS 112371]|uniref:Uncharacterized protein n=1 Tax=Arthroderma benhamiae (strain ATCC MYA-4681 / CBS 112371) TaxID=663331 RepID=D4AS94_ARTBC|nr:uncharacterized protein ARB_07109 [Trichophyton benhamiae CBS 112371]EFE34158.1 hypothetical protein ARB_07109 [Trichophyton benhamiae CBS 112371]
MSEFASIEGQKRRKKPTLGMGRADEDEDEDEEEKTNDRWQSESLYIKTTN